VKSPRQVWKIAGYDFAGSICMLGHELYRLAKGVTSFPLPSEQPLYLTLKRRASPTALSYHACCACCPAILTTLLDECRLDCTV
jgi:hypothetical protein